jgi:hypothetical protein
MTLAESTSTTVQRVHPGGFFWNLERSDRLAHLVRLAAQTQKLAIVTNTVREAEEFAERLTLSGVPVHLASDVNNPSVIRQYQDDRVSTLVTTHEYALNFGPVPAPMIVHLRTALSVRDYSKRLDAMPSAVHLSFVVPEDHKRATSLISHFGLDHGHSAPAIVSLGDIIDLTDSNEIAMVSHARRRFPPGR